jgi:hypothetical protein
VRDGRFWIYPWRLFEIFPGVLYHEAGLVPVIAEGSESGGLIGEVKSVREIIEEMVSTEGDMVWRERALDDKTWKSGGR